MNQPPKIKPLADVLPEEPYLLMGAGPVPIPRAVAVANAMVINHLGKTMNEVIKHVKTMVRYVMQTDSDKILGISGPSSAGMEMAITNLLWPGRKALVLRAGVFSARFGEMASLVGADVTYLDYSLDDPITVEKFVKAISEAEYDVVTITQGETSCGLLIPDLDRMCQAASELGLLVVVDAVCTLATMPIYMDKWHIDALITGGQKGLSAVPGVALVAFSSKAWEVIENRTEKCTHWCVDALKTQRFWGDNEYHYTAPVPGILALYEALRLICEETLERRFERHQKSSEALQTGIEAMGLRLLAPKPYRLNSVIAIEVPQEVDTEKLLDTMTDEFHVEIAKSPMPQVIRIGQMGEQCHTENIMKTLHALGMSLIKQGCHVDVALGMAAMEEQLSA